MAKDLNKVMLTGHLGRDPEMRYTPNGAAVTTFSVASGRSWKSSDGTQHDETEWFSVVAWDKLGEICNQYLQKGTRVYIEGRLQTRSWEDKDTGEKKHRAEVVATDMIILSSKSDRNEREGGESDGDERPARPAREAAPAPTQAPRPAQAARPAAPPPRRDAPPPRGVSRNVPQSIENDEDLPF